jgi:hypothetical protein
MNKISLEQLIDIAFAVEEGDPIDWNVFREGKEQTMRMIAASVLEQFDRDEFSFQDRVVIMATITKLLVENMILHAQLMKK